MGQERKSIEVELDVSDSEEERASEDDGPPQTFGSDPCKVLGDDTMAYLQAPSMNLKSVHTVLVQVQNLASGSLQL